MSNPKTAGWEEPGPGTVTAGDLVGLRRQPTIRLSTCRQDGRCPVCDQPSSHRWPMSSILCGCVTCAWPGCGAKHTLDLLTEALLQRDATEAKFAKLKADRGEHCMRMEEERDAAIRQVEEQRHPCLCGKDTASIKWARCYSCRQEESEALDAAIREMDEARTLYMDEAHDLAITMRERDEAKQETFDMEETAGRLEARADRAEALLRECQQYMGGLGLGRRGQELLAKIRGALGDRQ